MLILAQLCGLFGGVSNILSSWQNERKKMLMLLLIDNICYFSQYILLGALSGACISLINFFRTLLFINKKRLTNIVLVVFMIIYLIIGILTFDGIYTLIPTIISIFYVNVLWLDDEKLIRKGSVIMLLSWCIYNLSVNAYVSAIIEFVLMLSNILAIYKLDLKK